MQSLCVYTTASLWNIAETNFTFRDTGHESKDIEGSAPFRMKASAALNSAVNVAAALASLYTSPASCRDGTAAGHNSSQRKGLHWPVVHYDTSKVKVAKIPRQAGVQLVK